MAKPTCTMSREDDNHFCEDALRRFWAKVHKHDGGCWVWTGAVSRGYGGFTPHLGMRTWTAHRYAYTAVVGAVPEARQLDHLCRNTICVNPAHLEPVTARVNILRSRGLAALNARKRHCPRGHEYDRVSPQGARLCTRCSSARRRANENARYHNDPVYRARKLEKVRLYSEARKASKKAAT